MTGSALRIPAADAIAHRRACDIAVDPVLDGTDELTEEQRRRDGATVLVARVLQIRRVALHELAELLDEGHPPHELAAALDRSLEEVGGRVVRRVPARASAAEAVHARAREGRVVDEERRLERARVRERVREDEPALRVCVVHLDGLAVERAPHVAGTVRVTARHVLRRGEDAVHLDVRLQARDDLHEADDVRRSAHVVLHVAHPGRRLDGDTTRVERDALAHDHDALEPGGAGARGDVRKVHHARFAVAALADGREQVHSALLDLLEVEDLDLEVGLFRHRRRRSSQRLRVDDVRRLVRQVAREVHARRDDLSVVDLLLRIFGEIGGEADRDLRELRLRLAVARHVLGEAVGAHLEAFDDLAEAGLKTGRETENELLRLVGVRSACSLRRERADVTRAELCDVAEPDHDETVGLHAAERRHRDLLVLLALELFLLELSTERSPEGAIEAVERRACVLLLRRTALGGNTDDHQVANLAR